MNAAIGPLAVLVREAAGQVGVPSESDDADAIAQWQAIFAAARPVEPDPEAAPDGSDLGEHEATRAPVVARFGDDGRSSSLAAARRACSPTGDVRSTVADTTSGPTREGKMRAPRAAPHEAGIAPGAPMRPCLPALSPGPAGGVGAYRDVSRGGMPQPARSTPDAVSVLVQGAAITLVVRDAALSDAEALSCAFEAARELAGMRGALRSLVLNGRTLYERLAYAGAARPAGGMQGAQESLKFAC